MVIIKSIDKSAHLLILGSDQDPNWEYRKYFSDGVSELDLLELAQNIYEQYGPSKQANLSQINDFVGAKVPSKVEIEKVKNGEKSLTDIKPKK